MGLSTPENTNNIYIILLKYNNIRKPISYSVPIGTCREVGPLLFLTFDLQGSY